MVDIKLTMDDLIYMLGQKEAALMMKNKEIHALNIRIKQLMEKELDVERKKPDGE